MTELEKIVGIYNLIKDWPAVSADALKEFQHDSIVLPRELYFQIRRFIDKYQEGILVQHLQKGGKNEQQTTK